MNTLTKIHGKMNAETVLHAQRIISSRGLTGRPSLPPAFVKLASGCEAVVVPGSPRPRGILHDLSAFSCLRFGVHRFQVIKLKVEEGCPSGHGNLTRIRNKALLC